MDSATLLIAAPRLNARGSAEVDVDRAWAEVAPYLYGGPLVAWAVGPNQPAVDVDERTGLAVFRVCWVGPDAQRVAGATRDRLGSGLIGARFEDPLADPDAGGPS